MNILHVTFWPGPPFSGLNVNCYHFLKRLTPKHHARFIVVAEDASRVEMTGEALAALGIPNEGVRLIRHRPLSALDRLVGVLTSGSLPYLAFWEKAVGPLLRESTASLIADWKPDALVVWSWMFGQVLSETRGCFRILYACDSVSLANRTSMLNAASLLKKAYHGLMASRCRGFEQSVLPLYDHVVFISQRDADEANLPAGIRVSVISNGVDTSVPVAGKAGGGDPKVIVFHGNFGFLPNSDSLSFLIHNVGPALETEFGPSGFEMRIFGAGLQREHLSFAAHNRWLKLYGYVEDLFSELTAGTLYVAPVAMGAGVKNKVLDAMNCGLPVVGTPEAFSGLDVVSGVHCVVRSRDLIVQEVIRLLQDPERCQELASAARQWVAANLNWDKQAALFDSILDNPGRKTGD